MAHILVADNDETYRRLCETCLIQHGYTVFCVENGKEAWMEIGRGQDQILGVKFDLVIIENKIPELSGMNFLKILDIIIPVILTCTDAIEMGIQVTEEKFTSPCLKDFLEKPYTSKELIQVVDRVLAPSD